MMRKTIFQVEAKNLGNVPRETSNESDDLFKRLSKQAKK